MGKHDAEITPAEQAEVIQIARSVAKHFAEAGARADAENRFPTELVPIYKESGLPALAVPKKYGGLGADIWTTTLVSRELAKGDPAIALAFNMHQTMIGIFRGLLNEETRQRVFAEVVNERKIVCGPFSEDRAGLTGLADTVAVPDGEGGWHVSGKKTWATLCLGADIVAFNATVTDPSGELPEDFQEHASRESVFVIPIDSPGVSIVETWDTLGMRATGTHTLVFDKVHVPASAYGGNFRNGLFGEFEWASLSFSGVYLGLAEKAYTETREILKKKSLGATQEGKDVALKGIGYIQYGLGKILLETETAARALETTARILIEGRDAEWNPIARAAFVDVTKVAATETAIKVTDAALRLVGGSAFRRGHVLERLYRDARGGPFHPLTTDQAYDLLGRSELGLLG
ncbi:MULTISPECIES: acyl-CoA dehydrogenase family protein [Protofrankia]|uniref:Acyl-CoA dehydrogenase domain-containing protein n=1 Tax=Candidatus Protofrankia datiscae TaxID=2716812 RepID=F8AY62_9ACTN|nr:MULTISPECIES: acyl-CoA dehydrogenase family protein [Protofrankia]AEH09492.1 acyl-CoA dehydrogenase domain-containing protein [Candidatus Protofrankia datiscae]